MRRSIITVFSLYIICLFSGCDPDDQKNELELSYIRVGTISLTIDETMDADIPVTREIYIAFDEPLDPGSVDNAFEIITTSTQAAVPFTYDLVDNNSAISITLDSELQSNTEYTIELANALRSSKGGRFQAQSFNFKTEVGELRIESWTVNTVPVTTERIEDVPQDLSFILTFSSPLNTGTVSSSSITLTGLTQPTLSFSLSDNNSKLTISSVTPLLHLSRYTLNISSNIKGVNEETFAGLTREFYTAVNTTPKFPVTTDDALLTKVQEQTFKYFWDFAHPTSGMARERNTSGDIVTSGGSGFGIMSIIVGIERGFITRQQGIERLDKILDFLETADRFHGVWPHWLNGTTGKVVPFSTNDNGGDLVETSFLMQGLLTFRQYLNGADPTEQLLVTRINALWNSVEWSWYTNGGQNVLYWHWSPDKAWIMNHPIKGYNEALITYVLAASSETHSIPSSVYHQGWASSGGIQNGKSFYNITLPVGFDYGGPLFFAHYSFLGLDPRNLSDTYANYWTQNVNHSKINHAYVVDNPKNFVGYSDENWGLTASDNHTGYSAHSPTNDLGVITPTAALSSFPYTPVESMKALKFFYYTIGDKLWGPYGFYDAFNVTQGWTANSYLAIDQGPIIIMIENHRTGLLWDLFMSAPEVQAGLDKLSFSY
jgi:hypothetical protein